MGNSQSKSPELAVYEAVVRNDLISLQRTVDHVRRAGQWNAAILGSFIDRDGRNALLVAVRKNFYQCARKLLELGADPRYINPSTDIDTGGTALHEATRTKNKPMAELLLSYGANPHQANYLGRTCMDEAVSAAAFELMRKFEEVTTPWRGTLSVRCSKLAGLSTPYKDRYCAMVPYIPFPVAGQPPLIRRQLWVFRDRTRADNPKARVWLDGATMVRTGQYDAVLRLHTAHKPPSGDVYWKYDRGYCLFVRCAHPSDPHSREELDLLVAHVNSATGAPASSAPSSAPPSHAPSSAALPVPVSAGVGGATTSTSSAAASPSVSQDARYPAIGAATGAPAAATAGAVAGLWGGSRPASTPPSASDYWTSLTALPGESDAEFASRLSSAFSLQSGPGAAQAGSASTAGTPSRLSSVVGTGTPGAVPRPVIADAPAPTAPSAPPPPSQHANASPAVLAGAGANGSEDDNLCVICLSAPREAGYLHGATLHRCVCRSCCTEIAPGDQCPLCRQPVERVVGVY